MVKFKLSVISAESMLPDRPFAILEPQNPSIDLLSSLETWTDGFWSLEIVKGLLGENRFFSLD